MARYAYDRLTALDNSFLVLEKANAYMHVASTQIHEAGPLRGPDGGIDGERFRELAAASLHRIPRYRQKLAYVPIEGSPVWVDDDRFNLTYHIRHTSLPRPGTERQLKRLSARIMQQHLDRRRPLWEMWLVEGLEGDRFAVISKIHHCMIDGVSGVDIMKVLMRQTPDESIPESPSYIPRPAPSRMELLRSAVWRRATLPLTAVRDFSEFVSHASDARREIKVRARAVAETLGTTFHTPSETPINGEIGPHRRFDWMDMPISEIKVIRKALGGSLNDVVLTIVTGAVRRFLERRQVNPRDIEFRVMTPVSVRSDDEHGTMGNRVSAWTIELPLAEADPRKQLEAISKRTAELKESKQAVGAEVLTQVAEWTPSTLLALGARNATRIMPFNMVVTNVPGPQYPMYMLGSRMVGVYPHVPLIGNLGLGVALLSYDGKLHWGFNADWDLIPDLHDFVLAVQEAFRELRALGEPIPVHVAPEPGEKGEKRPASRKRPAAPRATRGG